MIPSSNAGNHSSLSHFSYQSESFESYKESTADGGQKQVSSYRFERYQASYSVNLSQQAYQLDHHKDNPGKHLGHQFDAKPLVYSHHQKQDFLAQSSESLSSTQETKAVENKPAPMLKGAENILKFVEQRLQSELAEGATMEELEEILAQGMAGFKQGYGEAMGILQGDKKAEIPAVADAVSTLKEQVMAGFGDLKARFLGEEGKEASSDKQDAPEAAPASISAPASTGGPMKTISSLNDNPLPSGPFTMLGTAGVESPMKGIIDSLEGMVEQVENVEMDYGRKDRFNFELTTLDGDKITIEAMNTSLYAGKTTDGGAAGDDGQAQLGIIEGMEQYSDFNIKVSGDIDEQEQAAIEDLLTQVMGLADKFYNGDIDKAYEAAINMGYDQSEIASYSLELKQTEQYNVAAVYQALAPTQGPESEAKQPLAEIGSFAQDVLESLSKPENFQVFDYSQFLSAISQQLDQQIQPSSDAPMFGEVVGDIVDKTQPLDA